MSIFFVAFHSFLFEVKFSSTVIVDGSFRLMSMLPFRKSSRIVRIQVFIGRPLLLVCGSKQFANAFLTGVSRDNRIA